MAAKKQQDDQVTEVTQRETRGDAIGPGEPVEAQAVTQMGATFADRSGKKAPKAAQDANSTFADRAKAAKKSSSKAVDSEDAENKAVKSADQK